jgi:hypothetical protein
MNPNATSNGGLEQGTAKSGAGQPQASFGAGSTGLYTAPQQPSNTLDSPAPSQAGFGPSTTAPLAPVGQSSTPPASPTDVSNTTNIEVPPESPNIEVEWVERVDNIVNKTTGNPYVKSRQLGDLKNEYISKMYGKSIAKDGRK